METDPLATWEPSNGSMKGLETEEKEMPSRPPSPPHNSNAGPVASFIVGFLYQYKLHYAFMSEEDIGSMMVPMLRLVAEWTMTGTNDWEQFYTKVATHHRAALRIYQERDGALVLAHDPYFPTDRGLNEPLDSFMFVWDGATFKPLLEPPSDPMADALHKAQSQRMLALDWYAPHVDLYDVRSLESLNMRRYEEGVRLLYEVDEVDEVDEA